MTEQRWNGDGLSQDDLAIPEIKLIQNTGGDIAKGAGALPGQFYSELTDETFESFEFVVAAMSKSRTYWGRTEIEDDPPECGSIDMIEGFLGKCDECEHRNDAPWLLKAEERRSKCLVTYSIMGINLTNNLPVLLRASGLSSQAAKQLYTQLTLNPLTAKNWAQVKTIVTSQPRKTPYGDAFAIKFSKLELIPIAELPAIQNRVNQIVGKPMEELPIGQKLAEAIAAPESREPYDAEIAETVQKPKAVQKPDAPPIRTAAAPKVQTAKKIDTDF